MNPSPPSATITSASFGRIAAIASLQDAPWPPRQGPSRMPERRCCGPRACACLLSFRPSPRLLRAPIGNSIPASAPRTDPTMPQPGAFPPLSALSRGVRMPYMRGPTLPSARGGQTMNAPHRDAGFFTESLRAAIPRFSPPSKGTRPPARRDRADRLGEHRLGRRDGRAGLGDDQQVRRGLSRAGATMAAASMSTSPRTSPSTGPRRSSAWTSPTCSPIPAARPTRACSRRC
jgi:hypothetical protein